MMMMKPNGKTIKSICKSNNHNTLRPLQLVRVQYTRIPNNIRDRDNIQSNISNQLPDWFGGPH